MIELAGDQERGEALRANAIWLIARLESKPTAATLRALLADRSPALREEAARGLAFYGGDPVVDALLEVLVRDEPEAVRTAAVESLGMIGSPRSATRLIDLVRDPHAAAALRADAAEALAHVGDDRIIRVLGAALADESPLVRYSAAYALAQQAVIGRDVSGDVLATLRRIALDDESSTQWGPVAECARESIEIITGRGGPAE